MNLKSALRYGVSFQAVAAPYLFDIPQFLLETAPAEQRPFLIMRAKQMTEVNSSGASDPATRQIWQRVINRDLLEGTAKSVADGIESARKEIASGARPRKERFRLNPEGV